MTQEQAAALAKQVQNGETEAFGNLYDAFIDKIYTFIYFKTHHKETAEDLTSQSFLKALNKIDSFKPEKGSFSSWIYQIAGNTVIDHYRTNKETKDIDDAWDISTGEDIERDTGIALQVEQVQEYLSELKTEQRDIILMRLWQDMSYKEIAEALGKTESSCKMTFKRTIEKLRKEMPLVLFLLLLQGF